jgi:hypothetical protein
MYDRRANQATDGRTNEQSADKLPDASHHEATYELADRHR